VSNSMLALGFDKADEGGGEGWNISYCSSIQDNLEPFPTNSS
jgi:hypothetical protein